MPMPRRRALDSDSRAPLCALTTVSVSSRPNASTPSSVPAWATMRSSNGNRSSALTFLLPCPSDGDPVDAYGRVAQPGGHPLPVLAADALAGVEVGADRVDAGQNRRAIADQVGAADRMDQLTVVNHPPDRHAEDEVARRGIHLATAN